MLHTTECDHMLSVRSNVFGCGLAVMNDVPTCGVVVAPDSVIMDGSEGKWWPSQVAAGREQFGSQTCAISRTKVAPLLL